MNTFFKTNSVKNTSHLFYQDITEADLVNIIKGVGDENAQMCKHIRNICNKLRNPELAPGQKNNIKLSLPCFFTSKWKGERRKSNVTAYLGSMVLDIDLKGVNSELGVAEIKSRLLKSKFAKNISIIFVSPSGGLKVVMRVNATVNNFTLVYKELVRLLQEETGIEFDKTSDSVRACYFSYDEDCYYNNTAETLRVEVKETVKASKGTYYVERNSKLPANLQIAINKTNQIGAFEPGNRANYICVYAGNCYFFGVELDVALWYARQNFESEGFDMEKEVIERIQSLYTANLNAGQSIINKNITYLENPYPENKTDNSIDVSLYICETEEKVSLFYNETIESGKKRILVQAPTGAGKSYGVRAISKLAIEMNKFKKVIFIAPNIGIGEQMAAELGVTPINQNAKPKNREMAMENDIIVATYNQLFKIVQRLKRNGLLKEDILIIVDEAHSCTESFRSGVMDEAFNALEEAGMVIFLTATPKKGLVEVLDIDKVVKYNVINRAQKRLVTHLSNDVAAVCFQLKKILSESEVDEIIPIYINSENSINKVKTFLLEECGLENSQIGTVTSDGITQKGSFEDNNISQDVYNTGLIPDGVRVVFITAVAEYGINILNTNIYNLFIWNNNNSKVSADSIVQISARFRRVNGLNVHCFYNEHTPDTNSGVEFSSLFVDKQNQLNNTCDKYNFYIKALENRNNKKFHHFAEGFIKNGGFEEKIRYSKINGQYEPLKFAALTEAHILYDSACGFQDVINDILSFDNSFKDSKTVLRYNIQKDKKTKEASVNVLINKHNVDSEVLNTELMKSSLITEKDAQKEMMKLFQEFNNMEGVYFPFIITLLQIAVFYYGFDVREYKDGYSVDGIEVNLMEPIVSANENTQWLYNEMKNRGNLYFRANVEALLIKFFMLLRRGFNTSVELTELSFALLFDRGLQQLFNVIWNSELLVATKESNNSEYRDVQGRMNAYVSNIPDELICNLIETTNTKEDGIPDYELRNIMQTAAKKKGMVTASPKTQMYMLKALCNIKEKRIRVKVIENGVERVKQVNHIKVLGLKAPDKLLSKIDDFRLEYFGTNATTTDSLWAAQVNLCNMNNKAINIKIEDAAKLEVEKASMALLDELKESIESSLTGKVYHG